MNTKFPQEKYDSLQDEDDILSLANSCINIYKDEVFEKIFKEMFNRKYDYNIDGPITLETHPEFWEKYSNYHCMQHWENLQTKIDSKAAILRNKSNELRRNGSFVLARYLCWKSSFSIGYDNIPREIRENKNVVIIFKNLKMKICALENDPNNESLLPELVEETIKGFNKLREIGLNIPDPIPEFEK